MPIYPYSFTLPPVNKQDIPSDGVAGEFLGISAGGVLDWLPVSGGSGSGDLLAANNLSELTATAGTARTNLGLGTGDSPTFKNLVISTGSIATSAPVTISQTWDALAVAFTGLNIGITDTNSHATSSLFSVKRTVGVTTSTLFSVEKEKIKLGALGYYTESGNVPRINSAYGFYVSTGGSDLNFNFVVNNDNSVHIGGFQNGGRLYKDGNHQLGLRDGAAAQTFNVYGTYSTSPSLAYSRLAIACDTSGNATLTTQSTGTAGTVSINGVPVGLGKGNVAGNVAVGLNTLATNTGTGNVAVGTDALPVQVAGNYNTAVGRVALYKNINGGYNTAIGNGALFSNLGGANNVAVGESALANSLGSFNIGLGMEAGASTFVGQNTTANSSIFLGFRTKALGNGESNQIVIGHDAIGLGSNTAVLGNASITTTALRGNVGIGTTAPSSKLHVVGNGLFGEKISTGSATPLNVSFGGTYGTSAPGSKANLKWDLYTDAIATNRFGIGMSVNLMEIQAGDGAGFGFYPNAGTTSALHIISSGNVGIGTTAPAAKLEVVGNILLPNAATIGNAVTSLALGGGNFYPSGTSGAISTLGTASVPFFGIWVGTSANAAFLTSDSADTLALRNAGAPQAFRVYNTYTDASNYERGGMAWIGGALHVGVLGTAGTGSPTRALQFVVNNGAAVWNISTAGHFLTNGDNAYDIGASGANRPRDIYVGTSVNAGVSLSAGSRAALLSASGNAVFTTFNSSPLLISYNNGTELVKVASSTSWMFTSTVLVQFGGTTASFPALKRSTTYLQARLADDSAFAPIQGKLTTDTAYTATVVAATGYITIYDSNGTAYRVPCAV